MSVRVYECVMKLCGCLLLLCEMNPLYFLTKDRVKDLSLVYGMCRINVMHVLYIVVTESPSYCDGHDVDLCSV